MYGESVQALLQSVESGERQICYLASGYLSRQVSELSVLDLPFAIRDRGLALSLLDGPVGASLAQAIRAKTGFELLAFWDNGFRHLSNRLKPLRSPVDCQGLSIRTLDSEDYRQLLSALGFIPRSIDVRDLVAVLASGEVDAQENPLTNFQLFRLHRFHPHLSLTRHLFGVVLFLANKSWFDQLDPAQKQSARACAARATKEQRTQAALQDEHALATLRASGVAILGDEDLDQDAFRNASAPLRIAMSKKLPEALVRAYVQTRPASGETAR